MEIYGSRNERKRLSFIDISDSKVQLHGFQDEKEAVQTHILHRYSSGTKRLNPRLLQQQYNPIQNCIQSIRQSTLNSFKESFISNEFKRRPQINRS